MGCYTRGHTGNSLVLDHRYALAMIGGENVIQESRLPRSEEAGQHGHGHEVVSRGLLAHRRRQQQIQQRCGPASNCS